MQTLIAPPVTVEPSQISPRLATPARMARNMRPIVCPVAIVALALAERAYHLGRLSLWLDEGISVGIARLGWPDLLHLIGVQEINMSFYYLLLKGWLALGSSEWWVRALSLIAGVVTVVLLYLLGRKLFGTRSGLIAALLLALNVAHIRYSQEARSYALVVLLCVTSSLLFADAVLKPNSRRWTLYAIFAALSLYTHLFAAFVLVAQWISLALLPVNQIPWKHCRSAMVILGCLLAPVPVCTYVASSAILHWLPPLSASAALRSVVTVAGNSRILLAFFAISLAAAGIAILRTGRGTEAWKRGLVAAWAALPILLALLISTRRPAFEPRYLLICAPAFALLAGAAVGPLRPRALQATLVGLLLLVSLPPLRAYYRHGLDRSRDDWRGLSHYVIDHAAPGDAAMFYGVWLRNPFEYYRWKAGKTTAPPKAIHPGRNDYTDLIIRPIAEDINNIPATYTRVWLVLGYHRQRSGQYDLGSAVWRAWCSHRYQLVETKEFDGGLELLLFARPRVASPR